MTGFAETLLGRTRLIVAALIFILGAGAIAWRDIPKEAEPDVKIPIVYVQISLDGIAPEDAERLLVQPLETELRPIEGVKEMRSSAFEGGGFVLLEFDAGFDSERALADVRQKVARAKGKFPSGAKEPEVHEVNLSLFPVLVVTLAGDVPERTLVRLARDLRDRVEQIPSVLEARIAGDREELLEIIVDPMRLEAYGLSIGDLLQLVGRSNQVVPAGALEGAHGRFAVKVPGLYQTVADVLEMPLKVSGDAVVRVGDVASGQRSFKDRASYARIDGKPGIALEISKRVGENLLDTVASVRAAVMDESASWPAGVKIGFSQDKSADIRQMLGDLENNLAVAILLVLIVVLATLGWRTTTLVAVAVPGSFLGGILLLSSMGYTVNIVVLFGLIFAAGNVVDGAIVITEYADARMAEGMKRREAYALAVRRMSGPIISATATNLAAFLPLAFWPGLVGEFMKFLPISQFVTMFAALLMAMIFVPALGSMFGGSGGGTAAVDTVAAIRRGEAVGATGSVGVYIKALRMALRRPGLVLTGSAVLLIGVWWAYGQYGRGVEFFPDIEPKRAIVQVSGRGNLSIDEKDRLVGEVEDRVLALGRERGEFASVYTRTGKLKGGMNNAAPDVIGVVQVELADWQTRRRATAIFDDIRRRTADVAGVVIEVTKEQSGPPTGKAVQLEVSARDPALLGPSVETIVDHLNTMTGLRDFEDTRPLPGIQWTIAVNRAQSAKFGGDITLVGQALKLATNGLKLGVWRPGDTDEEIDIVVRFPPEYRTIGQLDRMRIQTRQGMVPISNFVERGAEPLSGTLNRTDARRVITIKAAVQSGVLADDKIREIRAWLAEKHLPDGVAVRFKGQDEEQQKAQAFLGKAFGAAVFLIFLILIAQFNNFYYTFLILSGIVLSTAGVVLGLLITNQTFGIVMTGIGIVALAGIVVQNNIVLLDTYAHVRKDVGSALDAILITGAERLRPVLLTAMNNVLGLLPLCFGINIDFIARDLTIGAPSTQMWIQLSQAIVYGLIFSTILTLVLTPCALMVQENVGVWRRRVFGRTPVAEPMVAAAPVRLRDAAE
ncbi:MAG: efflux RND transporter permease subunit [Rhodospirillaceae bacterium]|nr:efflux RND transporter permease subunit [Rhodospirillaceae bacterium]